MLKLAPDMVDVVITRADGTVRVMGFITRGRGNVLPFGATWLADGVWERPANSQNVFYEVAKSHSEQVDPTGFRILPTRYVPDVESSYNDCRVDDGQNITYNMVQARQVRLNQLRELRAARLAQLDAEWMRAFGRGDRTTADAIEAQRENLRNMPQRLQAAMDAALTLNDLRAITLAQV